MPGPPPRPPPPPPLYSRLRRALAVTVAGKVSRPLEQSGGCSRRSGAAADGGDVVRAACRLGHRHGPGHAHRGRVGPEVENRSRWLSGPGSPAPTRRRPTPICSRPAPPPSGRASRGYLSNILTSWDRSRTAATASPAAGSAKLRLSSGGQGAGSGPRCTAASSATGRKSALVGAASPTEPSTRASGRCRTCVWLSSPARPARPLACRCPHQSSRSAGSHSPSALSARCRWCRSTLVKRGLLPSHVVVAAGRWPLD